MTIEERVARLEANWGKDDPLVRELRGAVTVTAEVEHRHRKLVKERSYIMAEHEGWLKRDQAAMEELDRRIAGIVSAIGALIAAQSAKPKSE